jgi:hypothetical protein
MPMADASTCDQGGMDKIKYERRALDYLKLAGYDVGRRARDHTAISVERDGRIAWLSRDGIGFAREDVGSDFCFVICLVLREAAREARLPDERASFVTRPPYNESLISRLATRCRTQVFSVASDEHQNART